MLDEVAPEILWIAGIGSTVVFGLMVLVWFVSTRGDTEKREEDKDDASTYKPKKKKQYVSPRKSKEVSAKSEVSKDVVESEATSRPKSIMKGDDEKEAVSKPQRVEFEKKSPRKETKETKRVSPPTPHPQSVTRTLAPIKQVSDVQEQPSKKEEKKQPPQPTKPNTDDTKSTTSITSSPKVSKSQPEITSQPVAKKQKGKTKQTPSSGGESMSGSRIAGVIANSSLSPDEVGLVMERLLEKHETNEEWEATTRSDSVKVLKRLNNELQNRCVEAEKAAQLHSARVKELSVDLRQERARNTAMENSYQGKLAKNQEDMENLKGKLERYKKDVEELQNSENSLTIQKLKEDNSSFQHQLAQIAQQNSQLSADLATKNTELTALQDTNSQLKKDLKQNKETSRDSKQHQQQLNDLKSLLAVAEQEKEQILHAANEERVKLNSEIRNLQRKQSPVQETVSVVLDTQLGGGIPISNNTEDDEKNQLEQEITQLKEEYEQQRQENIKKMNELQNEHGRQLEASKIEFEKEIQEMRDKIEDSEESARKIDELKQEIKNLTDIRISLENELNGTKESLVQESSKSRSLQNKVESLSNGDSKEPDLVNHEQNYDEEKDLLKKDNLTLQEKINDLKKMNNTLRDDCFEAKQDLESTKKEFEDRVKEITLEGKKQVTQAKQQVTSQLNAEKALIQRIFPDISLSEEDHDDWLTTLQQAIQDLMDESNSQLLEKDEQIKQLKDELDEGTQLTDQLKDTLSNSLTKFDELMNKWQQKEEEHTDKIAEEQSLREKCEEELQNKQKEIDRLNETIKDMETRLIDAEEKREDYHRRYSETDRLTLVAQQENESLRQSLRQELNMKENTELQLEELKLKSEKFEIQISELNNEKEVLANKCKQFQDEVTSITEKLAEVEKLNASLRAANQDLNVRLTKFSPSHSSSSTSSEV